jgi:UDP-N-acetyl-D-mannosaminuronic acid dehydrogenase
VKVKKLYESFVHGDIYTTSVKQAAVVKLMENTFRDVNIGLANELSLISRDLGIDIWKAIEMANKHPRVDILKPGPGVGGHCIPIDPWFLSSSSKSAKMIPLARKINDNMPKSVANKVKSIVSKHKLKDPTVGLLGYAYKKNVDDDRESPAREIQKLLSKEYRVLVNDPFVESNRAEKVELDELLKRCQVIILVTDHDVYKNIRFNKYNNVKIIYDSRNLFGRKNVSGSNAILYTLGVNVG